MSTDYPSLRITPACLASWNQMQEQIDDLDQAVDAGETPDLIVVEQEVDHTELREIIEGLPPGGLATCLIGFNDETVEPEPLTMDEISALAREIAWAANLAGRLRQRRYSLALSYHRAPAGFGVDGGGERLAVGVVTLIRLGHLRLVS